MLLGSTWIEAHMTSIVPFSKVLETAKDQVNTDRVQDLVMAEASDSDCPEDFEHTPGIPLKSIH